MGQETLINKLKNDLAVGRVVTITGTGVSVAACGNQDVEGCKVATWMGLLQHGVQHCRDKGLADDDDVELLTRQIKSGRTNFLISAAEDIAQRLSHRGSGVFRGWLKDTIGKLSVRHRAILDAVAALPGVLATLNYDNLLEDATGRTAITWLKADKVQDVLRRETTDAVLHLHGWFDEPESVVLGLGSYLAVKDHPHARAVLELFTIDRTLLFVGCGGTVHDPNFSRLIEWGKEAHKDVSPRHYLLCRTSEVAGFQHTLQDAPWLQPLDYGASYDDLVPFLRGLVPAAGVVVPPGPASPAAPSFDLPAYQQAMRRRYGRLKLEDLDPTTHDIRVLTLTGMFIAQSARECAELLPRVFELPKEVQQRLRAAGDMEGAEVDEDTLDQHRRAYLDQSPAPITTIVNDPAFSRLVILGDPGSGKSTLLQYLLLTWAERTTPDPAREPLPLLIELREYARLRLEGLADGFLDYLHAGAGVRWHLHQAQLGAWLRAQASLVLFDGLDEVFDPTLRREISTAIHRFADEYPRARVIVTSRIIGYQHPQWRDEGFRHFMLQELDPPEIAGFLARWHRDAYEDPDRGEAKRTLLARAIEDSAAIRQLAGNPLLLTMMAILNRTQDLPRDRAELYEQCARLLLHQWKVEAAFSSDPELTKASLDFKDKRGLLLRVAHAMQTSERGLAGNLIDEETLEETLAAGLKDVPHVRPERAARALIEQLRGRNFMLCSVGGRSYAFVHRTFLEYFCAVEVRERFQTEQTLTLDQLKRDIFGHWPDEAWSEVLCLLAGMLAPHFVARILDWLLAQPDPDDSCRHVFLAGRCVGEVRKRTDLQHSEHAVHDRAKALLDFDLRYDYEPFDEEAQAVAAIRTRATTLVATVWRDTHDTRELLKARAQSDEHWAVRQRAVQELARGWRDDPETLPMLKARAQSDEDSDVRQSAIQELARGWRDDPETLPWLKAQSAEDSDVRQSAVQELARGWRDDPETLPWLKARVQSAEYSDVRQSAVQELAYGWKGDPETLPMLKARAQSDEDWAVRQSAVQALARGWKDDHGTLPMLKARAQSDEDPAVRQSAVQALARGWKDDPETLPILKARAQSDEYPAARLSAVQELARGWRDDPETLSMLKARAQSDEYPAVRLSAVQELARGWKDDPETLPWLKARAQSDEDSDVRQSAVQELARGWKDDPETLPWLKARAQSDEHSDVRQSAIQALARGWRDDPETLPWLKARVQSEEDSDVRQSAVQELARGWKDDPETLPWLKVRAQSDEHWAVRQSAARALARGWKADPETLPILKVRAQSDEHSIVRQSAVRALARGWKADPETLPWLKARAQSDEHSDVRQSAVHELARGWRDDPETLPILKARAQPDEHSAVRQSAVQELARGWKDDPETLPILKVRAQSDAHPAVRQIAVQALARGWKDDPETLPILKVRAQSDEDWAVRLSAVQALARGWRDDPETLPILKARAQSDEDSDVRQSAVLALARGWRGDPEILPILKACAQSDEDSDVRQRAVLELARGWKDDPEVQKLLQG